MDQTVSKFVWVIKDEARMTAYLKARLKKMKARGTEPSWLNFLTEMGDEIKEIPWEDRMKMKRIWLRLITGNRVDRW